MGSIIAAVIILLAASTQIYTQELTFTGPDSTEFVEGKRYAITWVAQHIDHIDVIAKGTLTSLGGDSRGQFTIPLAESVPADRGRLDWIVPWIDSVGLRIELVGYSSAGKAIMSKSRSYGFRPAVMAGKFGNGIYLDLHDTEHQRLYVQKSGRITKAYLSTSSRAYDWRSTSSHPQTPHDHAGVFKVLSKTPMHWSRLFQVEMPFALRYHGGHFIHATSPNQYPYLGTPASSGCNRLTYEDAQELYRATPVGTKVYVFGPK